MMTNLEPLATLKENNENICVLIDGTNIFIRNFCANTAMDKDGSPIGGTVGFLKFVSRFSIDTRPNQIVVCWDGPGGSVRRRSLFGEYKKVRKPLKINRFYDYGDKIDFNENKRQQIKKLMNCMKFIPATQIVIENCETDDVIAHITQIGKCGNIIVSDDRDFIQLIVDGKNILYRPSPKKFYDTKETISEFGISPANFPMARALIGDNSDNVGGIKGVGIKRITSIVPELSDASTVYDADYIVGKFEESKSKTLSERVRAQKDVIIRNYNLMKLDGRMMSPSQMDKIKYQLDKGHPKFNKIAVLNELISCGVNAIDIVKPGSFNSIS